MSSPALGLVMALALVAGLAGGCDARFRGGHAEGPASAAASAEPRLSPAFSQSGRVEAGVLSPLGPGKPEDR